MPLPATPWLNPPDVAGEFTKGLSIGASIGQEQARLQAEHERTLMEATARAETAKQSALQAQARIQTEAAYRTATLGLQQQRLQDAKAENDAKTKEAALKLADQQGFAADMKSGMKIEDALFRHPRLSTPAAAVAAHKDTLDLGTQRLDLRQQQIDLQARALTDRENKQAVPPKPPAAKSGSLPLPEGGTVRADVRSPMFKAKQAGIKGWEKLSPDAADDMSIDRPPTGPAPALPPAPAFQKPAEVRAALKAKQITRDQAGKILRDQFGME